MKIKTFLKTVFALSTLSISAFLPLSAHATDITLACSPWYPFVDEKLPGKGFYSQIVTQAAAKVGINVTTKIMPWKRVVMMTKAGQIDGISCPVVTEERRQWLAYADDDFYKNEIGFFSLKDKPLTWQSTADLTDKKIAALASSAYVKQLQDEGLSPIEYIDISTGLKMLAGKRFDAIYEVRTAAAYTLSSKFPELSDKISYAGTLKTVFHRPGISLKHPQAAEIAKKLSEGYRQIKADGTLAKIMEQANLK